MGQICVVGELLWQLFKVEQAEQESGWAHLSCHPAGWSRHRQGEWNITSMRIRIQLLTEDCSGVSYDGEEKLL